MPNAAAPTDQRAGVRPIAFVLQDGQGFSAPITLKIRPEELVVTQPSRGNITQTMGRGTQGWLDYFGEGLPTCRISGHTGWRQSQNTGEDGFSAFMNLNTMVKVDYPAAKQAAIDAGSDPDAVKLLFVDMLDEFCWSVLPQVFELKRHRSRPLLLQYSMFLPAISTDIDTQFAVQPFRGTVPGGLTALSGVLTRLGGLLGKVRGWIAQAVAFKDSLLAPIAATISRFTAMAHAVFGMVNAVVNDAKGLIAGTAADLIYMAGELASVGVGLYRTISNIAGLPSFLMSNISRVGAAFNEVLCIFGNSLRPRKSYSDYDGLFGASNCSSTTGGRLASSYADSNAFALMQRESGPISMNGGALSSVSALNRMDPVLAPLPLNEIGRHVEQINSGIKLNVEKQPGVTTYTLSDG